MSGEPDNPDIPSLYFSDAVNKGIFKNKNQKVKFF